MRWPLKNQILVRLLPLLLITIVAITYANIQSAFAANRERELERMQKVTAMLSGSQFPLTSSVLENMSALSGAEFIVTDAAGAVIAKSVAAPVSQLLTMDPNGLSMLPTGFGDDGTSSSAKPISIDGHTYLVSIVPAIDRRPAPEPVQNHVHVYVPQPNDSDVWWDASRSPLWIAAIILPVAVLISIALASQVTRPLARLKSHVQSIAEGNLEPIETISRDDEVGDLNSTINEMTVQLRDHDVQLRHNERLRMLLQFGNGLAHNLRNSATGCKMAVELLAQEHRPVAGSDAFVVAGRQLQLMETYIQRFLSLAKTDNQISNSEATQVNLFDVLEKIVFLLTPSAAHLNVELTFQTLGQPAFFEMHQDDAEQLMINLISNAITAASEKAVAGGDSIAKVVVHLNASLPRQLTLTVRDNGTGPPEEIAADLFQPFVSGKQEGIGLGLALVNEIADRVGGKIQWSRQVDQTEFKFEFIDPDRVASDADRHTGDTD